MAHTVDEGVTIACSEDRFAASREYCRHDWVAHDRRITMSFCGKTLMDGDACKRHAKLDLFGPFVFFLYTLLLCIFSTRFCKGHDDMPSQQQNHDTDMDWDLDALCMSRSSTYKDNT